MINFDLPGVLEQAGKLASAVDTAKGRSMVEYTGATRITPLTIIDKSLLALPELQDTLQILASLDAAYQMMGIQLSVNSINGISIIRQLDKLNPTRGAGKTFSRYGLGRENYQFRLPTGDKMPDLIPPSEKALLKLGTEAFAIRGKKKNGDVDELHYDHLDGFSTSRTNASAATTNNGNGNNGGNNGGAGGNGGGGNGGSGNGRGGNNGGGAGGGGSNNNIGGTDNDNQQTGPSSTIGRNTVDTIMQDSNLAVGKLIEVDVTVGSQRFTIPVQVRLNTFTSSPQDIANIVANINPKQTAKEVKALYQAGLISLWDAITGKTAANEWRKAAMKDKTGVIMKESNRRAGNKLASFTSGTASIGDISSIYVISENTAREIEGIIGGKLENFKVREKMLADTGVMLLAVMDPSWKMVTIYHHSIDSSSKYSFADLKRGGKSNNHDMGMVLEAFRQGQAPSKFF